MNIELVYFSGTGNSWKILDTIGRTFEKNGHNVTTSPMKVGTQFSVDAGLIGICCPVYAFGMPRIVRKYLNDLAVETSSRKAIVVVTAGKKEESGFTIGEISRILRRKMFTIVYSEVVEMPANWTTYMNPPTAEAAISILEKGQNEAQIIAENILQGNEYHHCQNIPPNYGRWGLYREYALFRFLGIHQLWRSFKTYDTCNGCGKCAKSCPTQSIQLQNNVPHWSATCEQCMRCVNFCPNKAIYQSMGGDTATRNQYHEPDFKPI
jgi:ferredoxin